MIESGKPFSMKIDVRFADLDAYAHVNGSTYFTYMETAWVVLYESLGLDCVYGPLRTFMARSECDYRVAISAADKVQVDVIVSRVGNSSFDMLYRLHNTDGTTFAVGKTVMVTVDALSLEPAAVPDYFRQNLMPKDYFLKL